MSLVDTDTLHIFLLYTVLPHESWHTTYKGILLMKVWLTDTMYASWCIYAHMK